MLLRPLARRRDNTLAPPLVFIRVRNPCTFERFRRLGENVRFGMKNPCSLIASDAQRQTKSINEGTGRGQTGGGTTTAINDMLAPAH